jgi:hypothetical protein
MLPGAACFECPSLIAHQQHSPPPPRPAASCPHTRPQEYFGITPDVTTMGKVIGGGLPVGAYGGKREIMEMVAPAGPMYQAGKWLFFMRVWWGGALLWKGGVRGRGGGVSEREIMEMVAPAGPMYQAGKCLFFLGGLVWWWGGAVGNRARGVEGGVRVTG